MGRKVKAGAGRGEGAPGREGGAVVGRCSELLQAPERMTPLVSCGTGGHWAFAESCRENTRDTAVGFCRGVVVA